VKSPLGPLYKTQDDLSNLTIFDTGNFNQSPVIDFCELNENILLWKKDWLRYLIKTGFLYYAKCKATVRFFFFALDIYEHNLAKGKCQICLTTHWSILNIWWQHNRGKVFFSFFFFCSELKEKIIQPFGKHTCQSSWRVGVCYSVQKPRLLEGHWRSHYNFSTVMRAKVYFAHTKGSICVIRTYWIVASFRFRRWNCTLVPEICLNNSQHTLHNFALLWTNDISFVTCHVPDRRMQILRCNCDQIAQKMKCFLEFSGAGNFAGLLSYQVAPFATWQSCWPNLRCRLKCTTEIYLGSSLLVWRHQSKSSGPTSTFGLKNKFVK
jgi:hypothetical protein